MDSCGVLVTKDALLVPHALSTRFMTPPAPPVSSFTFLATESKHREHLCFVVILVLGWVSLGGTPARGQHDVLSPRTADEYRLTQYVHEAWELEDGLPQNSIYAALQSRDGYLWLGTQEGLVRFDGVRFRVFDKAQVDELRSNEVRALLEDRAGGLWIGTNGGGLTRFFEGTFTTYGSEDGLSNDLVRALYEDRQGAIWIGTIEGGLNRFDPATETFTHYTPEQGLAGAVVLAMQEDRAGDLWVGTEAGLSRLHEGTFTTFTTREGLPGNLTWALHVDRDGTLWAGTTGGLARLRDDEHFVPYMIRDGLCGEVVSALDSDPAGNLWIGTLDGGLCRLHDGLFDRFTEQEGLTNDRVRALYRDQESSLWIGTEGGGLNRLRAGKFTPVTAAEGLSSNVVFTVLEDRDDALWVGTEGGGLNRLDAAGITQITKAHGLPSNDVYALHEGRDGALWVGLYNGGLCRLASRRDRTTRRLSCFNTTHGLPSDNIYALHEDRDGALWIGTDAGLSRMQDGHILAYAPKGNLPHDAITALLEDHEGSLWVGSYGGLSRIRDDQATTFTAEDGLSSTLVLTLYEDRDHTLWIGTQEGGLCRLRNDRIACITTREGLFNDNVLQILEDDDGFLWLGSLKGIARVPRQALNDVAEGRRDAVTVTHFGQADGLKSSEASGGTQPPAWRSRDGRLWFSTIHGLAAIDPTAIPTNPVPPPVVIESVSVNGRPIPLTDAATLPPGSKDLVVRYTGLSFAAPQQVHFAYILDGYDDAWMNAETRRDAYYTNLPPGAYRFRVKARNNDGVWNETGATFSFYLQPHFYQTAWFYACCVLSLLVLGLAGYRMRINQLKVRERELEETVALRTHDLRLEKEKTEKAKDVIEAQADKLRELDRFKTRFFANISHEFRTPLTMIVGPLENALHGHYGSLEGPLQGQVQLMLRNAQRLLRLINQLLDLSKLEAGKMHLRARPRRFAPFLEGIVLSCTAFAEHKAITLNTDFETDDAELYFEPDKLEKVFFNLLSNAMKYTPPGGTITVAMTEHGPTQDFAAGYLDVRIQDSGIGIPEKDLPHVFDRFWQVDGSNTRAYEGTGIGLSLVRELVLLHHGTITVTSEVRRGTTFTLALPKGKGHLKHDELVLNLPDDDASEESALVELASADFNFIHEPAAPSARSLPDEDPEAPRPLLLVVDDNADVLDYVRTILVEHYRVVVAQDGEEGLAQARAVQPDLIISDVMMPKMDGHTLCRHIKTDPDLNHTPVILLTARATHQSKIAGLEVGADDYMAKPFNAYELLTRTKNLLTLRRQSKELKNLNDHLEQKVQDQLDLILAERERYEAELILERDKAEASSRFKSSILNNMSHELRTPITAIQGFSQILSTEVDDVHAEFVGYIEQNAHRLLETLSAILDLAKLEAQDMQLQAAPFDLAGAVQEAVGRHQSLARQKELALRAKLPPRPVEALLDRAAFVRILDLLIGNAVKYTEAGDVLVDVDAHHGRLTVNVRDTGIGIGEAFLPHLFDAFIQESSGLARQHEGNGLGLAITKRLVDALGGEISVESRPGDGSVFTVSLPHPLRPAPLLSTPAKGTAS